MAWVVHGQDVIRPEDCSKFALYAVFSPSGCSGNATGMLDAIQNRNGTLAKIGLQLTPFCDSSVINITERHAVIAAILPADSNIFGEFQPGGNGHLIVPEIAATSFLGLSSSQVESCRVCSFFGDADLTYNEATDEINDNIDSGGVQGRTVYDSVFILANGRIAAQAGVSVTCNLQYLADKFEDVDTTDVMSIAAFPLEMDAGTLALNGSDFFNLINGAYNDGVFGTLPIVDLEADEKWRNGTSGGGGGEYGDCYR